MKKSYVSSTPLSHFSLWKKTGAKRSVISFTLELTSRCTSNCRHCYINLPAKDQQAEDKELSINEIGRLADEAVSLGVCWCLLSGGEPLLREDFFDIYLLLKRKGLLVSVFTNAVLITPEHVTLFQKYPPRNIEVSVYGVTEETYERVTRTPGSYKAFLQGLNLLLEAGVKIRFKAMALRSNVHEFPDISRFCRERTKDYFRFDPFLHLRYDGNPVRNAEIKSERLSPVEIADLEQSDRERLQHLKKNEQKYLRHQVPGETSDHLFSCGVGNGSFTLSSDGVLRACDSLYHPGCIYNWREGNLADAWNHFIPGILKMRTRNKQILEKCKTCHIVNLCMWCPAHAYLETGKLDEPVDYFCQVAHARAEALGGAANGRKNRYGKHLHNVGKRGDKRN